MHPVILSSSARQLRMTFGLALCTRRYIHATPRVSKFVKEKVSDVADKVNKRVGKRLASAIETGEKATGKTKKVLGATGERAKAKVKGVKQGADRVGHKAKEDPK